MLLIDVTYHGLVHGTSVVHGAALGRAAVPVHACHAVARAHRVAAEDAGDRTALVPILAGPDRRIPVLPGRSHYHAWLRRHQDSPISPLPPDRRPALASGEDKYREIESKKKRTKK